MTEDEIELTRRRLEEQVKAKAHQQKERAVVKVRLMAEMVKEMVTVMVAKARAKARAEMAPAILAENRVKNVLAIALPKMAILNQQTTHKMQAGMAAIQTMKAVKVILPAYLLKIKMP